MHPGGRPARMDGRTVGVVAHHVASGHATIGGLVQGFAAGMPAPGITPEMIDGRNAEHAQQYANCSKQETAELLDRNGAAATAIVRRLTDEQLARTGTIFGSDWTTEQVVERILIGHPQGHLAAIRAAG